jgi:hypothetical protein
MWESIKVFFNSVFAWLKPIVMAVISFASKEILDAALDVVKQLAMTDLTNEEKREAAFDQIKEMLKAEGKEVGSSMINLLIELAVQKLKAEGK